MAALSVLLLAVSAIWLGGRLLFPGVAALSPPAYFPLIASLLGFLAALVRSFALGRRRRSKNKLKKVRRCRALMVLNLALCVVSAALWLYGLIVLL